VPPPLTRAAPCWLLQRNLALIGGEGGALVLAVLVVLEGEGGALVLAVLAVVEMVMVMVVVLLVVLAVVAVAALTMLPVMHCRRRAKEVA
jgi:hypothetical protein